MKIKLVKIIFIVMMIFIIFGNINCKAVSLDDMQIEVTDGCFGESEPITTTNFSSNYDDTFEGTGMSRYFIFGDILSVLLNCIGIVSLYTCIDTLINSIKARKFKIRMGCLKVLFFLLVLIPMVGISIAVCEKINENLLWDDNIEIIVSVIAILFTILVYGIISVIVKFIKSLIKREPITTNWFVLFLSTAVVVCAGIIFIWIKV